MMERLTDRNFNLGFDDTNKLPSYEPVYEKLRHYENLEESLRKSYGDCDNLLEEIVSRLIDKNSGESQPKSARLLTNEDAEKWIKWKELEEEGKLIEIPCKPGDTVYVPSAIDNYIYSVNIREISVENEDNNIQILLKGEFLNGYGDVEQEFEFQREDVGEIFYFTEPEAQAVLEEINHAE